MTKREQITQIIEDYIINRCPKDKHSLTALEIRKWPEVDVLCINKSYANICNAMDAISIQKTITNNTPASTTHEITF